MNGVGEWRGDMNEQYADVTIDCIEDWKAIPVNSIVYLYGAGNAGGNILNGISCIRPDISVQGFIDTNKTGEKDGLPIVSIDAFVAERREYDLILITSSYFNKIVPVLKSHKIDSFKIVDVYFVDFDMQRWEYAAKAFDEQVAFFSGEKLFNFNADGLPIIDLVCTVLGRDGTGYVFYIFDFITQTIRRWKVPFLTPVSAVAMVKKQIPREFMQPIYRGKESDTELRYISASKYVDIQMRPHVCHYSEKGYLFAPTWNGFTNYLIETSSGKTVLFPEDFEGDVLMYSATNCFSADQEWMYFVRWPLQDSIDNILYKRDVAHCTLCKVRLRDLHVEELYSLEYSEEVHQVTCTPDERYVVFTTFKHDVRVPYPLALIEEDIEGYRCSHESGIPLKEMVTVDLHERKHWATVIPTPVPAHFEFDPKDPYVFYVSTHNCIFHGTAYVNAPILEGPGTLHRVRILDGKTVVEASYSDPDFLRIFQHIPFFYEDRTYIAVATTPNKIDILDADSMTVWKRVELFEARQPDFSLTGNVAAPFGQHHYNCVNPSRDGRYIVLGSMRDFAVFDMKKGRLLDVRLPLPKLKGGDNMIGHTRTAGY